MRSGSAEDLSRVTGTEVGNTELFFCNRLQLSFSSLFRLFMNALLSLFPSAFISSLSSVRVFMMDSCLAFASLRFFSRSSGTGFGLRN